MDRREFIKISSAIIGLNVIGTANNAHALLNCTQFNFQGLQKCEAGIDSRVAHVTAAATGGQHMSEWCWAACIEMVFRYYGLNVPQEIIVQQTWGTIANLRGQPSQIIANLNRTWRDSRGRSFYVSSDTFSSNPMTAAQDLSQDMPLIIGTLGHAMVLTSLQYVRNQMGNGQVQAAIVRDPWPGRGRRILSPQEWYNTSFLARIRVSRA